MPNKERSIALAIYIRLLGFYPRDFRERFGEQMQQTFQDLYGERGHRNLGPSIFRIYADTSVGIIREQISQLHRNIKMENLRSNAIISSILCLPAVIMFSLLKLHIEPPFADMLKNENPDQPNVIGSLIALFIFLLLPASLFVSLRPVVIGVRAGRGILASPANLFVAAVALGYITMVVSHIIIDQYPCWIGVPNCD